LNAAGEGAEDAQDLVGLSRAAFARRFIALTGRPPLTYLTWWRMVLAGRLLRSSDVSLAAVAGRVGYASEFAFAKAFKRHVGVAHRAGTAGRRPCPRPADPAAGAHRATRGRADHDQT
jgi:AraC-like DNA-binding protein